MADRSVGPTGMFKFGDYSADEQGSRGPAFRVAGASGRVVTIVRRLPIASGKKLRIWPQTSQKCRILSVGPRAVTARSEREAPQPASRMSIVRRPPLAGEPAPGGSRTWSLKPHVSLPTLSGNYVINSPYDHCRSLFHRSTSRQEARGWTENGARETAEGWAKFITDYHFYHLSSRLREHENPIHVSTCGRKIRFPQCADPKGEPSEAKLTPESLRTYSFAGIVVWPNRRLIWRFCNVEGFLGSCQLHSTPRAIGVTDGEVLVQQVFQI
jgi:hypothetical protein